MLGATTTIAIRFTRPRGGAVAALPTRITTSSSPLSRLFHSQCSLLTTKKKDDTSTAIITPLCSKPAPPLRYIVATTVTGGLYRPFSHYSNPQVMIQKEKQVRWFASESGEEDEQQQRAAAKNEDGNTDTPAPTANDTISGSSQHDTWVQFQRSIAVSGVDTGQTVKERNLGKKNRGGKLDRKRKEREAELEAKMKGVDTTQLKGGEFPTLSYSEEETERLLAEAYAAIPPRAGKRGTLNLRREKRRWFIKRQYDYKKKREKIATHERRQAKIKLTVEQMRQARAEAPGMRLKEKEYQDMVLQRWAVMNGHAQDVGQVKISSGNDSASV